VLLRLLHTEPYIAGTQHYELTKEGQPCVLLQAAMNYNSSRVFVWRLLNNVSIGENGQRSCTFQSGYVAAPTHMFGQVLSDQKHFRSAAAPGSIFGEVTPPAGLDPGTSSAAAVTSPPGDEVYSLSFGYVSDVFELPADAQDKFMQIQNVTLTQLPQLPPDESAGSRVGRLLRQLPGSATPPGVWTILLWPWRR